MARHFSAYLYLYAVAPTSCVPDAAGQLDREQVHPLVYKQAAECHQLPLCSSRFNHLIILTHYDGSYV